MSRIGNKVVNVPAGVEIKHDGNHLVVKGPKGQLEFSYNPILTVEVSATEVKITRPNDEKFTKSIHGTTRAIVHNLIVGVSEGYKKGLEIVGVGYKFNVQGNKLTISAGYSHPVVMEVPAGLTVTGISNTEIEISGIDKEKIGEFAANVRKVRKPEPYKGKGIKYKGEQIRRKEGKKASK